MPERLDIGGLDWRRWVDPRCAIEVTTLEKSELATKYSGSHIKTEIDNMETSHVVVASIICALSIAAAVRSRNRLERKTRSPSFQNPPDESSIPNILKRKSTYVAIQEDPIDVTAVKYLLEECLEGVGAVAVFEGITRDNFEGKEVIKLEYEAYTPMALKILDQIAQEGMDRFKALNKIIVIHRVGSCPVGETSLYISTFSAHRAAALNALPFIVDEIKARAPIWKLEFYRDGSDAVWKENAEYRIN